MNPEDQLLIQTFNKLQKEKLALEKALEEIENEEQLKLYSKPAKEKSSPRAIQKEMAELLAAFRLSGISVSNIEGSKMTLLFDTSYRDRYFESYYVVVEKGEIPTVIQHTLPFFVPIASLVQEYLETKQMKEFATTIHSLLCAYVRRRQQLLETKDKFRQHFVREVESSLACDYIRIDFAFRGSNHVAVILFYGLQNDLPQKVDVHLKDCDSTQMSWCTNLFQNQYLEEATHALIDRLE